MAAPEIPAWLKGLPLAPEYRPTETEFADPIAFISRIEREAAAFGICKVIPPLPKPSRKFVLANLNRSLTASPDLVPGPGSGSGSGSDPRPAVTGDAAVFTTRHQELGSRRSRAPVQKQVWQSGEVYTLEQFEAKSKAFARSQLGGFREVSPLLVETLFWKAASEKPIYVEYANDVPGSGFGVPEEPLRYHSHRRRRKRGFDRGRVQEPKFPFPAASGEVRQQNNSVAESSEKEGTGAGTAGWKLSNSPWNLQVIARSPGSLTRFMPDEVPGVTSPMVYIGMLFSWFAWHVEDHELHSLNFLHMGSPKTWYAVPGEHAATLEDIVRVQGYGGNVDRLAAFTMLGEKTTLLSPEVLVASGVPCCRLVQHPGEFVVTFPRAYHVGFSHGFNCGEAANFATPQWLKVAKEAAIRRAAMNYLPMLSHQQLLYMLTISFISRVPREILPGVRSSRLRDRKKEEREILVKKAFLDDMVNENHLLCDLLAKKSIPYVVLWEPELLPSPCTGHQTYSSSLSLEAHGLAVDDGHGKAESQLEGNNSFNCKEDDCSVVDADKAAVDVSSISSQNVSSETHNNICHPNCRSSQGEVMDSADVDEDIGEDDLPFGLHVDSGSLACVACGILGYPFMAILQPSEKALREFFSVNCEESDLKLEKSGSLGEPPLLPSTVKKFYSDFDKSGIKPEEQRESDLTCNLSAEQSGHVTDRPSAIKEPSSYSAKALEMIGESSDQTKADNRSGISSLPNNSAYNTEYQHVSSPVEHLVGEQNLQSENALCAPRKDTIFQHSKRLYSFDGEEEYDGTVHMKTHAVVQNDLCSSNFSSTNPLNETERLLGTTMGRSYNENTKWNTSNEFLRSRIFCLQHALEIEEMLQCKGGAHVLIICHSDYLKIKALAISIAEEIGIQFNCKDVPLENASPSDLNLINTSIDDEEHEEDGKDWTSKLGVNLKHCIKLRKQQSSNQERLALSLGGIFSDPSPVSHILNLKWLSRKSRTHYKVIGTVQSNSDIDANTEKNEPLTKNSNFNPAKEIQVYKSRKNERNDVACKYPAYPSKGVPKELDAYNDVAMGNGDDHRNTSVHAYQTKKVVDDSTDNLHTVPILIAEYPQMHQDSWATKKISTEDIIYDSTKSCNFSVPVDLAIVSSERLPKINCRKLNNKMIAPGLEKLESSHPYFDVPMLECAELEQGGAEGYMSGCKVDSSEKPGSEGNIVMLECECSEVQREESVVDETNSEHEIHGAVKPVCEPTLRTDDRSEDMPEIVMADPSNSERSLGMASLSEEQLIVPLLSSYGSEMHLGIPSLSKSELKNMDANSAEGSIEMQEEIPAARESILQDGVASGIESQFTVDNSVSRGSQIQLEAHLANDSKANCGITDYLKSECQSVNMKPVIDDSITSANTGSTLAVDGLGMLEFIENNRDMSLASGNDSSLQNLERHNKAPTRDLIQYVRRRKKRKLEAEQITESHNSCIGFVRSPCEGLRPRSGRTATLMADTSSMEKKVSPTKANRRPEKALFQKGKDKGKDKGKEPFKCDLEGCQMSFMTRGELSLHKRNCCPYDGCGKRFRSHKYAMRHQCVHDDERPLKCPWKGCNMSFKWAWARTEHIRVHTGERPYKCKVSGCGQTFRFVSDFSRHRRKTGHYVNSPTR